LELRRIKALWGMQGSYEELFTHAAEAGYFGIEAPLPPASEEKSFKAALETNKLAFIAQVSTHDDHLVSFEKQVMRATDFNPLFINSQSARDSMSEAEQDHFFDEALTIEQRSGLQVAHETHRSRAMFTPWTTARLLNRFPDLRITADFSHWVNVCESHLDNHADELALAIDRSIHVHGRVGFPQGPQVPHPGAPEYASELALFTGWWQRIFMKHADNERAWTTFTAEFGPPNYMPTVPFTNKPIVDLIEVNQWMTDYMAAKYAEWFDQ